MQLWALLASRPDNRLRKVDGWGNAALSAPRAGLPLDLAPPEKPNLPSMPGARGQGISTSVCDRPRTKGEGRTPQNHGDRGKGILRKIHWPGAVHGSRVPRPSIRSGHLARDAREGLPLSTSAFFDPVIQGLRRAADLRRDRHETACQRDPHAAPLVEDQTQRRVRELQGKNLFLLSCLKK